MIPRLKPYYNLSDTLCLLNPFNKRNAISKFERGFANKFECDFGAMFAHGRTGMWALFKSWDLEKDEIICPAYTCVVVQHAIVLSGNIPVFVDCAEGSWNMDYDLLEAEINEKTKCIVVTHLFGYPMDVQKIDDIVKKAEKKFGNKIFVLQDVAHSFGARSDGELVTKYGDAAIFGLNISKMFNSIFGGMIITNDKSTYQELLKKRQNLIKGNRWIKSFQRMVYFIAVQVSFNRNVYGLVNWIENRGLLGSLVNYYDEDRIYFPKDWKSPPTNTEAAIGLNQLKKYDSILSQRRSNTLEIKSYFKDDSKIQFFEDKEGCTYSHAVGIVGNREEWIEKYKKNGIQLGILIEYSVPEMSAYKKYKTKEYPIAKAYSSTTINFPNWPGIKTDKLLYKS